MTRWRLVLRSLMHHRLIHAAVALGVAAATAVLTGALLVGDSVRGSLHTLTMQRLGKIDAVMALDRFFRWEMAEQFAREVRADNGRYLVAPAILFPQATLERRFDSQVARASTVLVLGCDDRFWEFDTAGIHPAATPGRNEVVLNEVLATELGAQVGDEVTLRLPSANQVPADSPLANKNDRVRSLPNLKVVAIVPARGLGRFQLQASQGLSQNAFVSLETLQTALDQPDRVNALFAADLHSENPDIARLEAHLHPELADFGVNVQPVAQTYRDGEATQTAFEYFTITTDRMLFAPDMEKVLQQAVAPLAGQPVLTYLANSIELAKSGADSPGIPYSMVAAINFTEEFALQNQDGEPISPLGENEVVLNSWAADSLQAKPGDAIRIEYFEPETTHGEAVERSREFVLKAITPLVEPTRPYEDDRPAVYSTRPQLANDPHLTPEVKGVTDQETIDDWDAPFPFDYQRVRQIDEDYWDSYRTTPKAFVSLPAGSDLWGSRFGQVTAFRVPQRSGLTLEELRARLEESLRAQAAPLGFRFLPIKEQQLAASRGTTPFDVLFLSLSFFVIAAALLIVALLFRLGIEQRATEIGTLLAVGFTRQRVGRLFLLEGLGIAAAGALLGIGIGVAYARLMLAGLSTWWLGAITTPFLEFHWTIRSLAIGYGLGVATALATIAWAIRETRRSSVRSLLSGRIAVPLHASAGRVGRVEGGDATSSADEAARRHGQQSVPRGSKGVGLLANPVLLVVILIAAVGLSAAATRLGGMAQAGAFVGAGTLLLITLVLGIRRRLRHEAASARPAWERRSLTLGLVERSASRNAARSVITVALMATATFLIVAMSSFRLEPTAQGVGGFEMVGQSAQPIYADLDQPGTRSEFFGTRSSVLEGATVFGLRLRPGDDASCQNLYQAAQPRVVGVTPQLIQHFDQPDAVSFEWAGSAATTEQERANPWRLLAGSSSPPPDSEQPIPVVLDKNTAMYSLHLYRGIGEEFAFDYDGRPVRFKVAGLLSNSVLQGSLFIGEAAFQKTFPGLSGYRYFLVAAPEAQKEAVSALLEERFSDEGLDLSPAEEILAELLAVQNTYLSTFQSLGALGLLLGAFGLTTVQLRNVLERRGELALMRAVGYRRQRLAQLVLLESVLLLTAGLAAGVIAALLAVLPHKLLGEAAFSWLLIRDLALMLAAVLLTGLGSSLLAVRAVLRMALLPALRGE